MISLLCPSRGRPEQFKRMVESAFDTAGCEIEICSASNGGDNYVNHSFPIDTPTVHMWNSLSRWSNGSLLMLCADDVIFKSNGWGRALHDHHKSLENKVHVYALQDSRDANGTPHPIVTREYMDRMGYFVPPIFLHWFVDTWTVEIARANNCFTHMKDYMLVHDKPSDVGKPDETHIHIRRMGWHDRDSFVNYMCQHFLELEKKRLAQ